jgi:hypothetical protein
VFCKIYQYTPVVLPASHKDVRSDTEVDSKWLLRGLRQHKIILAVDLQHSISPQSWSSGQTSRHQDFQHRGGFFREAEFIADCKGIDADLLSSCRAVQCPKRAGSVWSWEDFYSLKYKVKGMESSNIHVISVEESVCFSCREKSLHRQTSSQNRKPLPYLDSVFAGLGQ